MESVYTGNRIEGSNPSLSALWGAGRALTHGPLFIFMPPTFRVDAARARALAGVLAAVQLRDEWFFPRARSFSGRLYEAEFVLAWVGICHRTQGLHAQVDGQLLHGSDALAHRLREVLDEDPTRFSAEGMAALRATELSGWFRGQPAPLTRVDQRCALLNDLGHWLQRECGGHLAGAITAAKGRLAGNRGLFARLARTQAYRDPVRKKTQLLLQTLRAMKLFEPADCEHLTLPIDNHIVRVFLRTGVLQPTNERAHELASGAACTAAEDLLLRTAALRASKPMATVALLGVLDPLLWMVGRNCCRADRAAVCSQQQAPCPHETACSLRAATGLDCGLQCPLQSVCASGGGGADALLEPQHDTDLY